MTKREAWEQIAQAFERYAATGRKNALTSYGLCAAVARLQRTGVTTGDQWGEMGNEIDAHEPDREGDEWEFSFFYWPLGRDGAAQRAVFAQLLAETTEEAEWVAF